MSVVGRLLVWTAGGGVLCRWRMGARGSRRHDRQGVGEVAEKGALKQWQGQANMRAQLGLSGRGECRESRQAMAVSGAEDDAWSGFGESGSA
jgi:hypothetical protein